MARFGVQPTKETTPDGKPVGYTVSPGYGGKLVTKSRPETDRPDQP